MVSPASVRAPSGLQLSRRAVLAPLLGLTALPLIGCQGSVPRGDDPPALQTARRQFTVVESPIDLPAVDLTDLNGRPARLAPVPGKVLLINVWATWCEACRTDLPLLERFYDAVGDRVEVAAVSNDKTDREKVEDYLTELGIRSLPIYLDRESRLASGSATTSAVLPLFGMPVTFLITPSGQAAGFISGIVDWLSDDAQRLLAHYTAAKISAG